MTTELVNELCNRVGENTDLYTSISDDAIRSKITEAVMEKSRHILLSANEKIELINLVFNRMRGMDILQPLLDNEEITEIMVNGPDRIFIEKKGGIVPVSVKCDAKQLEDIIQKIVSSVNRTVNEANPICDARLKDGSRVHVVMKPLALNGPILTIRKFSKAPMDINTLISYGTITEEAADTLKKLVEAKYNIFICGGTGSGKTTFLNVLSNFIPKDERIITIEDTAELQITGVANLVRLETRNANPDGEGEIRIRDLIRAGLRMRPDRIVVGEVRGEEALDMLQAMNTGHEGSLSTGHGNSCKDMISRLETMVLTAARMPVESIRKQIASALDIMIFLSRMKDKSRKVMEVSEVAGYKDGEVLLNPLYKYEVLKDGTGKLVKTENDMVNKDKFMIYGSGMI
ncbi:MAG: CpaF family protein [Clostridiaceae bacterium]|nr:CpaF family protein [Clostridiaceae bacterium]